MESFEQKKKRRCDLMNGQRFDDPFVSDGGVTGPFHRPRALVRRFNCRRLTVCSFNRLDRPLSAAILEKKEGGRAQVSLMFYRTNIYAVRSQVFI